MNGAVHKHNDCFVPVAGIVIGAASGALSGKLTDIGIDDKFAKELSSSLPQGGAALLTSFARLLPTRSQPK